MGSWLGRWLRAGVDPRAPVRESKCVVLTNAIALVATAQLLPLAALCAAAGLRWVMAWVVGLALAFLSVIAVSATGRVLPARAWFAVVAAVGVVGSGVLLGPGMPVEAYLLVAVTASWHLWPRAAHAAGVTVVFAAAYVALLALRAQVAPVDTPPADLLGPLNVALFVGVAAALLGIVGWSHHQTTLTDRALDREHARSERLLRNVLPDRIAERLKDGPATIADRHEEVTVVFADIVGFTPLAATLPPERLVEVLNQVFTRFDELAARHGVEKIKTIGDAYMAVAGVPDPRADHADAAARLALDLRDAVEAIRRETGHEVQIRIGVCSGPAVAGVIGIRKFAYDLWGDTVNTAARMESHGDPGAIHVAASTRRLLGDRFLLEDRGEIEVKGKGRMATSFLRGLARDEGPAASGPPADRPIGGGRLDAAPDDRTSPRGSAQVE